jgi:hypothetical protein
MRDRDKPDIEGRVVLMSLCAFGAKSSAGWWHSLATGNDREAFEIRAFSLPASSEAFRVRRGEL